MQDKKTNTGFSFISRYGMMFFLLVMIIVFSLLSGSFFTMQNFGNMLVSQVTTGCVALGAMFILIVNEFDLSLGYLISFCLVIGAEVAGLGGGDLLVILSMIFSGILFGFINGLLTVRFNISSFIVTISVGLALSGISQAISGGGVLNKNMPVLLTKFAQGEWNNIGYTVIFWIILCFILYYLLNHMAFGRKLYAVGSSQRASYLAGIKTDRVRIFAFMAAGFFTSIGAVILLGQLGAASSAYGHELLLPAYTIVFLSKMAFKPGYFNVGGMVLAILFIGISSDGITIIGVPTWAIYIYEGAILIIAMLLSNQFNIAKKQA